MRRAVVGQAAEEALAAREEVGHIEVLDVQQRQHGRAVDGRHRDRERVVDDVGALEEPAELRATVAAAIARSRPGVDVEARYPVATTVVALRPVRCQRGDDRLVFVRPDTRQRPAQLARVGLAAARDPGDERQERQRDPHPAIVVGASNRALDAPWGFDRDSVDNACEVNHHKRCPGRAGGAALPEGAGPADTLRRCRTRRRTMGFRRPTRSTSTRCSRRSGGDPPVGGRPGRDRRAGRPAGGARGGRTPLPRLGRRPLPPASRRPRRYRHSGQGSPQEADALVRRAARVRPAVVQRRSPPPDRRPRCARRGARGQLALLRSAEKR